MRKKKVVAWSGGAEQESTIFPAIEFPDDSCYPRAIPSIRRAKPGLSDSAPYIRQVIQIKLLRKLLLYSSVSLSLYLRASNEFVYQIKI